jgi:ABC-type nitrate/sulfonate/bicarbonate transport system substrate-binding protein
MKVTIIIRAVVGVIAALTLTGCSPPSAGTSRPLRVGWQPQWANQGQVVEVLMHDGVLAKHGVSADFRPFTYGGPMTEAALAGEVDVLFVGNQPAITLISRDDKWRIAARLTGYRSAVLVPKDSPVRSLDDLRGKTLATAFGSTTHRDVVRRLLDIGIDPATQIRLVSLDQAEHATVIARGGSGKWGVLDAIATYDPTVAVALESGGARVIADWASPAVVVARASLFDKGTMELKNFLRAYIEAYSIYATSPDKFDQLFQVDSRLPLSPGIYRAMAGYEPNLSKKNSADVDVRFSDEALRSLVQDTEIAFRLGIIKMKPDIRRFVDQSALP